MGKRRAAAPASAEQQQPACAAAASPARTRRVGAHALLALLSAVAAAALFLPATRHHAVYDDSFVVASRDLHTPAREWLTDGLRNDCWGSRLNTATSHQQWRPALVLGYRASLWLHGCTTAEVASSELLRNKEACHDAQPPRCLAALHAHTVALHALNAAALHAVAAGPLGLPPAAAGAASLLFALHPVHVESVATVYGRADVQALLFQQAALLAVWRAWPAWASVALAALAALSKETGVLSWALLPAMQALSAAPAARRSGLAAAAAACTLLALGARGALLRPWGPPLGFVDAPALFLARRALRAASLAWLHARYIEALLLPWRQAANHGYDSGTLVLSLASPRVLICALIYAAALAVVLALAARARTQQDARVALFCMLWGVLTFAPSANIGFAVGTTIGERLMYLPSAPACILAAMALRAACARRPPLRLLAAVLAPVAAAALFARTRSELAPYACDALLWDAAMRRYPDNVVVANNLAVRLDAAGAHAPALAIYDHVEAVWQRTERMAAMFTPAAVAGMPLMQNGMRRAIAGRSAVLRPLLGAVALDGAYHAGGAPAANLGDAARALELYVHALQGRPDEQLGGRILARLLALCARWDELRALPVCTQAAELHGAGGGQAAPR